MTIERRYIEQPLLELRGEDDKKAAGYAAKFNSDSVDLGDVIERIAPGAFATSLREASEDQRNIYLLWSHKDSEPLASTRSGKLELAEDETGLAFTADTSRFNALQLGALEDGDLRMSFGFRVRHDEWERVDNGNGYSYVRTLKEVELLEVSLVTNPAYPETEAALRSLEAFKEGLRSTDNIDTTEQLKRLMFLKLRARGI